ncbi:ZZ-type zinc finger-containing protein 3 [Favolaschia claudopus]|uniref:ZZ-type zinc finger-containing protein 3 n=1 Tax=Favolaschia claudopus TaxID=2862362 RepID=A0AAW0ECU6_9AGAR
MPSPGHIALVTGLISSSYFTLGNLGAAYFGVMPATERGNTNLPVADRLALWNHFYGIAALHMPTSSVLAGLSLAVCSYNAPAGPLRNILAVGAVSGITVLVYTVMFMLALNNRLMGILRAHSVKPMDMKEQEFVLDGLDKWRSLHRTRMWIGAVTWVSAIVAVLANDQPIIRF